jgi:hypothetical protein
MGKRSPALLVSMLNARSSSPSVTRSPSFLRARESGRVSPGKHGVVSCSASDFAVPHHQPTKPGGACRGVLHAIRPSLRAREWGRVCGAYARASGRVCGACAGWVL